MFRNYLKAALRNLWNQRGSTLINVSGLTLGIASSLILFLMIRHMYSYDTYHRNRERIFRVVTTSEGNDGKNYTAGVPAVLHTAFRNDFPEVEEVSFLSYSRDGVISIPQKAGEAKKYEVESGIVYGEPNFFKIFDRAIIHGDPSEKALDEPNEVIVSAAAAKKYFGTEDPVGEVLKYDDREFKVTAVMEDTPSNTDLPFEIFLSMPTIQKVREEGGWHSIWSNETVYFMMKPNDSISDQRMLVFSKKYLGNDTRMTFGTQPFATIHFDERFGNYNYNTISTTMLSILAVIAGFLIVTACINFINLATAEAIKRSKEVGIRKSLGSTRRQLIVQFLGESGLVTTMAIILALLVSAAALTFLNPFLELSLKLSFSDPALWIYMITIGAVVTILSGLYPSLVVSGFNPVLALKNKLGTRNSSGFNLRRGLVVLQFFISQFFIIGTIVLISQMNFFRNTDLGFKKDAIISIPLAVGRMPSTDQEGMRMKTLREETSRIKGVEKVSLANTPPSSGNVNGSNFKIEGSDKDYETQLKMADGNYIDMFGLELLAGQNISDLDTATGYVVNEKLMSVAGFKSPQDIIGRRVSMWGMNLPVLGVVKNFHTMSLKEKIEPTAIFNRLKNYRTLSVKINPEDFKEAIAQIQNKWERAYPDYIFSYQFMDDEIKEFYETEQKMSVLLTIFTSMAIFIGCLGLFGLASFMANQKTKEIGIRKVLGASVESIIFIFSKEYVILIGIAFVLATPVAWYVMNEWLNGFAYKITLGPAVFVTGLVVTLALAVLTVGYKSFRAAAVNPASSLKSE